MCRHVIPCIGVFSNLKAWKHELLDFWDIPSVSISQVSKIISSMHWKLFPTWNKILYIGVEFKCNGCEFIPRTNVCMKYVDWYIRVSTMHLTELSVLLLIWIAKLELQLFVSVSYWNSSKTQFAKIYCHSTVRNLNVCVCVCVYIQLIKEI